MKEKNHISIYGCCVSRDGFSRHENDGGYIVEKYIQSISPFLTSKPQKEKDDIFADLVNNLDGLPNFYKKLLRLEHSGEAFDYFIQQKSDWLILDNGPFRYELYAPDATHLDDGMTDSILTLVKNKCARQIQGTELETISKCSKTDPLSWDEAIFVKYTQTFLKRLLSQYRQEEIILVRVENVVSCISENDVHIYKNLQACIKENARMQKAWEIMRTMLPEAHVIDLPITTVGNLHHKWGASGLHYADEYYEYFLRAVDIITQERLPLKQEREKLCQLQEFYTKRFWELYQKPIKSITERLWRTEDLKKRWEIYAHYSDKLLEAGDYQGVFLKFMQRHNYKSCAIYGISYPVRYLLRAFCGKITIDYIIENNQKKYEGIACYGRDQLPYLPTDVILIADMVMEAKIREKFVKMGLKIPYYGMNDLLL